MKRRIMCAASAAFITALVPGAAFSQSAIDAYQLSQYDLKGTARFMSMGGAFGALGGDLSTLSQNPAGIGVYRSSEIGFTLDLDCQSSNSSTNGFGTDMSQTKFYLNNIGGVATMRLNSNMFPNINIGFTYNKLASFNRKFAGGVNNLPISLSNYIAGIANTYGLTQGDLGYTNFYDPYLDSNAPWIAILGYDAYLIDPDGDPDNPNWFGQFGEGTSGSGRFKVVEKGSIDEYNIAIGGNINNKFYWGMNFDIVSADYRIESQWEENLRNAYVFNPDDSQPQIMDSRWRLNDQYRVSGTGFNYQLGVIYKPIQELRIGFAFHTPTWYSMTETFYNERIDFQYPFKTDYAITNNGIPSYNTVNFRSPWKIIASVAGVIGSKFIISADYEWTGMRTAEYYTVNPYVYDNNWWDYYPEPWYAPTKAPSYSYNDNPVGYTNSKIKQIYDNISTLRIGAEYRVTPSFSVRAGYIFSSAPVKSEARDGDIQVPAAGIMANYNLYNATNYVTCGLGYRYKGFYVDGAYVYKHQSSNYFPFSPDPDNAITKIKSNINVNNSQVVLSMGIKF